VVSQGKNTLGCESCVSRGLDREALGCVDPIRGMFLRI
jgi:hypothetical protein